MMIKQVEQFIKTCAWRNVTQTLSLVTFDQTEYWAKMYDAVTGDTPYDDLPQEIKEEYTNVGDLMALAEDLTEAYSAAADTLRAFVSVDNTAELMQAVTSAIRGNDD